MFGYIHINRERLRKEEKDAYQAYYCGLCRELKNRTGAKGQLLLQYDMTFLVVLLTGLYEPEETQELFVCPLHPTKKKTASWNETVVYAADMNLLLGYLNLMDDWKDDKSWPKKKLADSLKEDYEKVAEKYPRQAASALRYLKDLEHVEKNGKNGLDEAAGLWGEILAEIFAWKEDEWEEELKCMGYYLGKFIYCMDAWEDRERDQKTHSYNPLNFLPKKMGEAEFELLIHSYLTSQAAECARAFERLPVILHAELIRNILYSGIWSKYELLRKKRQKKEKR